MSCESTGGGAGVSETELRELLEGAGHKLTPPRSEVLRLLADRTGTFTAAELQTALAATAPEIGRATVFRTLDLLIDLGALERLRLPTGQEGYVLCHPHHHHHVVCSSCGRIGEVESRVLEGVLRTAVEDSGFVLQAHTFELSGVCSPCREEQGPAAEPTQI